MPGPIYPIWSMDVLPGDDIKVNVKAVIESLPMRAPMLGGGKATFAFYWCPWSNYYRFMDNNERSSTEDIINRKRHTFSIGYSNTGAALTVDTARDYVSSFSVRPGTLLDFLGVPPGFFSIITQLNEDTVRFSKATLPAEKVLSYVDIVRNYYVNNQENVVLQMESTDEFGDYRPVALSELDELMMFVRSLTDGSDLTNYLQVCLSGQGFQSKPGAGLFLRTYKMDLLRGIMNSGVGAYKSVVNVTDGQISMETIRFANKLQKEIDKIDITGGRFSEYMRSRWNVAPKNDMNRPIFLGSVASYIGNRDVVATATSSTSGSTTVDPTGSLSTSSMLGQQAGFSVGSVDQNRPVRLRADQYGTLMCVFSYVPYVDYSQGFELNDMKTTFADIYTPSMAQLGFQDVSRLELSALPEFRSDSFNVGTSSIVVPSMTHSVGKRVAWSEYMAGLNRNHGQFAFAQSMDYWVYNRMYTTENYISNGSYLSLSPYGPFDSTTYVKPVLWNQLFADTSSRAENFRLQANFEVFAKRPIGKRLMPHL